MALFIRKVLICWGFPRSQVVQTEQQRGRRGGSSSRDDGITEPIGDDRKQYSGTPVSYTHLTLPTILRV